MVVMERESSGGVSDDELQHILKLVHVNFLG